MVDISGIEKEPKNERIRLNVGGTVYETSLHTVIEGARAGGGVFKCLCAHILGEDCAHAGQLDSAWEARVFALEEEDMKHGSKNFFVDADPTPFPYWLDFLRSGKVPFVEAGPLRESVVLATEEVGLEDLAEKLRGLVDWRRAHLQQLLVRPGGANLHGVRLQKQDLSNVGFEKCSLRHANLGQCDLSACTFDMADLSGANLRECDLSACTFAHADLSGANIQDTNMSGCSLKSTILRSANLQGATLSGCDLSSCDCSGAQMNSTNLTSAILKDTNLRNVNLTNADLSGANIEGIVLGDEGAMLEGAQLPGAVGMPADKNLSKARLKGANLCGIDLSDCNLSGADLSGAEMLGAILRNATLSNCNLSDANLSRADLTGADLSGCNLSGCKLLEADLKNANMETAVLENALLPPLDSGLLQGVTLVGATGWMRDLRNAKLAGANLSGCDLSACDLSAADFSNANLTNTNLRDAVLEGAILQGAIGGRETTVTVKSRRGLYDDLKVGRPVIFALPVSAGRMVLKSITLLNAYADENTAQRIELMTGAYETGPWSSVLEFISTQTIEQQSFDASSAGPVLSRFVKILVHDTYGGYPFVNSMTLQGVSWGPTDAPPPLSLSNTPDAVGKSPSPRKLQLLGRISTKTPERSFAMQANIVRDLDLSGGSDDGRYLGDASTLSPQTLNGLSGGGANNVPEWLQVVMKNDEIATLSEAMHEQQVEESDFQFFNEEALKEAGIEKAISRAKMLRQIRSHFK